MLSVLSFLPATAPAFAQRGVAFGYKDRIFEQKYLLPDHMNALQAQQVNVTLTLRRATGLGPLLAVKDPIESLGAFALGEGHAPL